MEFWEYLKEEITQARIHELEKMEFGSFKKDLDAYNESTGFLRALRFIETSVQNMNKGKDNAIDDDGSYD